MRCQEEQQEEIETIGELIENFAGDLVGGTYSTEVMKEIMPTSGLSVGGLE